MPTPAPTTFDLLDLVRGEGTASVFDTLVAPLSVLLALRWAELHDAEQAAIAAFDGESFTGILPEGFSWSAWLERPTTVAPEMEAGLWSGIHRVLGLPEGRLLPEAMLGRIDPRRLQTMAGWVAALPFETSLDRRVAGERFTELVVECARANRHAGDLITPPALVRLAVALIDPRPGERIYDPCFGTGGLLVEAAAALWEQARRSSPGEWARAQQQPLFGVELVPILQRVAFVRLLLVGFRPALEQGDSLEREAAGRHHDQGFDCVLGTPPWGMRIEGPQLYDFPIKSRNSANLFVQHMVRSLRPGGRAIAIVPRFLLAWDEERELRSWLLKDYCVQAVVHLPGNALKPYTKVPASLLLVRRAPPVETVRIIELETLPDSTAACRNLARDLLAEGPRLETVRLRLVAREALLRQDARLDLPPESEEDGEDLLQALAGHVDVLPLGEFSEVVRGFGYSTQDLTESASEGQTALAKVGDITMEGLRPPKVYLRPEALLARVRVHQFILPGDIVLTIDGTLGKAARVKALAPNVQEDDTDGPTGRPTVRVAAAGVAILRPGPAVSPQYLLAVLRSRTFQAALRRAASESIIPHVRLSVLRALRIPLPVLPLQERLVRRLTERSGDALEVLLELLTGKKEDPLRSMFSGCQRLFDEGNPEAQELHHLVRDAIAALRTLVPRSARRTVVEGATSEERAPSSLPPEIEDWLEVMRLVPLGVNLNGDAKEYYPIPWYDLLVDAEAVCHLALQSLSGKRGLPALQAGRLTKRILTWLEKTRADAARDYTFLHSYAKPIQDESKSEYRAVQLRLIGSVGLRELTLVTSPPTESVNVERLEPKSEVELKIPFRSEWLAADRIGWYPEIKTIRWKGCQVDGVWAEGQIELHDDVHEVRTPDENIHGNLSQELAVLISSISPKEEQSPPDLGPSPYVVGSVIEDPAMFFGRQEILARIREQLNGGGRVILLEGTRRTGKTSILRQLQRPEQGLLTRWLPVECSFQESSGHDHRDGIPTLEVFKLLVRSIGIGCAKHGCIVPLPGMAPLANPNAFRFAFDVASPGFFAAIDDPSEALRLYVDLALEQCAPRGLLLMLDEFDALQAGIDGGITSPQVPENIRNLLQTHERLAAILTGSRRLKRLREEYWSALFGFGYRIGVDPLAEDEARRLVTEPVEGRLDFGEDALRWLLEVTARQPYLLQSLCARVFELARERNRRRIQVDIVGAAVERMVVDNEHLAGLWGYAGNYRRRYLLCLCSQLVAGPDRVNQDLLGTRLREAGLEVSPEQLGDDLALLKELELVDLQNTPAGPSYRLAIPLMAVWMEQNVDFEEQRQRAQTEQIREVLG